MTYIDAAAMWCARKRYAVVAIIGILGISLAGCGTNGDTLGSGGLAAVTAPAPARALQAPPPKPPARAKIAIAPIIGAPDSVAKQMTAKLTSAIEAQRVAISKTTGEPVDYTLRGYIVATREASATKISYIWDVTDPGGRRVNRITGEQIINGVSGQDPWVSVSPAIMQTITDKTASSFGAWLPKKAVKQSVAKSTGLAIPAVLGAQSTAAAGSALQASKALKPQLVALKPAAKQRLASKGNRRRVLAFVPKVAGAPGDGSVSLTSALQRELSRNGISLASKRSAASYIVQGKVVVGKAANGQQPIKIAWQVKDPKGKSIGSVSQKNKIPRGSLDGPWGKTADAAAAAAAQGILKLLPKATATN